MHFKPVVLGMLAAACITAAAGGAFLAVRQNAAAGTAAVAGPAPSAPAAQAAQPVTETEALVTPPAGAAQPVTAEAPDPATPTPRNTKPEVKQSPPPMRAPARPAERAARQDPSAKSNGASKATDPAPSPTQTARDSSSTPAAPVSDLPVAESARTPEAAPAPAPKFVEVTIPASAVIGLQVDRSLSSETANVEDKIEARVTRDVMAGGQRAIPAGSRMLGSVVLVERGGKIKEPARLGVRFHTLVLADGTEMPLRTEAIYRDGESPGNESSRKIGGAAVGGAILGAILGGGKGAMIGGATGAAGGTAAVMAGGRNAATLPSGTIVTARVAGPVTIQVEKEE
jgi:outer membrane biosynthesis protein TonB